MTKELQTLMDRIDFKRFAKRPPKKMLYRVLKEIERKRHYGVYQNWEWLVEVSSKMAGSKRRYQPVTDGPDKVFWRPIVGRR